MWTAVALTTVMTLAPAQGLELKNVRTTYGILGETRKDDKILPGDVIILAFDIEGLKAQANGKVEYSMGMEFSKLKAAKPVFKRDPTELEGYNSLASPHWFRRPRGVLNRQRQPHRWFVATRRRLRKGGSSQLLVCGTQHRWP